jgi:HEPN domain-containing protein
MRAEDPAEWIQFADDDLAVAQSGLSNRTVQRPRHVCFGAQQAAEKAIKALLIARGISFPFKHDLSALVDLLAPGDRPSIDTSDREVLSGWAAATRYPGDEEPDWPDAERAVQIAEVVIADVRAKLPVA